MNKVIEYAKRAGRNYITPEDVERAMNDNHDDPHCVRIDVLEVMAKQTPYGVEDASLCAFAAFEGPRNV